MLRDNPLVSVFSPNYLAVAVLCIVLLARVHSPDGTHHPTAQDPQQTSSSVVPSMVPTYYRDIEPILRQHCVACHRTGGTAPMSFETYEATRRYAYLIRNVTQDKAMPPQFAVPLAGRVTNDPSLSPAEVSMLAAWADLKAPAGDSHDSPESSRESAPWRIPKPDVIVKMPRPVTIAATGKLDYVYEIVPTRWTEGRWIQAAEVLPSLRANLLQIIVVVRRPGSHWLRRAPLGTPFTSANLRGGKDRAWSDDDILTVYAPGSLPQEFPATMGRFIPAGSDLVFRAQYITNGVAGSDQSSVGLVFSKEPPSQRVISLALENRRFTIPPNAADYQVEARGVLSRNVTLLSFFPLLHLRGKGFEYDVIQPPEKNHKSLDPEKETLLRVKYDLRWQPIYPLSDPCALKAGTQVRALAWYDNSANNPNNPNPNAAVNWGDRPEDEVLDGFFDVAVPAAISESKILLRHR